MSGAVVVEDAADPLLADFIGLTDRARRRAIEDGPLPAAPNGILVAEGTFAVQRLLESVYPPRALLLTTARAVALPRLMEEFAARSCPVLVAERHVVEEATGYDVHRGVLASAARVQLPVPAELASRTDRLVALEGVGDSENVGAVFRNAAAFGVGGILLDLASADPLYRRSVRVSVGNSLLVPFARATAWPAELDGLRRLGFTIVALTPRGDVPVDSMRAASRVVLVAGAEGPGLSEAALAAADVACRIPLDPAVDSLNVGTAVAIAAYEITRTSRLREGG